MTELPESPPPDRPANDSLGGVDRILMARIRGKGPDPDRPASDGREDGPLSAPGSFFRPGEKEPPRPEPGLAPGKVIGDFRLISLIGQGGMGQVWEAEQASLRRRVAVKFVRPERITRKHLAYFQREARAGGRLSHPGIVAIHGYGESDGLAWIAMELVEGAWTLRDFLDEVSREGEVPRDYDRHVARFVRDLARAMHAAHEGGVIHRDLKPQNVLITPENQPKVTDFGLARITDESALSQTGDFAGTYFYMSPEQVAARRMGVDHRTDIFSLGVVLYEMLALVRPFQGDTSHQVAAQIVTKDPPDPRTIRSRIPRDLVVICGKALEKDRDRRFASMAELAEDLDRFLADEPILARPPTPVQRVVKWIRRNPTRSMAGAMAVVAFAIISALLVRIAGQRDELELERENLSAANASLATRTEELSEANAALERKTEEAQENARRAENNALAERKRADEVLRLSLSQNYEDLIAEAERLWPARPDEERIEAYEQWIGKARALVDQLPTLRAAREEPRRDALPWTEEQRRVERKSHPEYTELVRLGAELESKRSAVAVRQGKREPELPAVDWSEYPEDARALNELAWPLVDPERTQFGEEALGVVLAERALEMAPVEERAGIWDTVAWGRLSLGLVEGAVDASLAAMETAPEALKGALSESLASVEAAATPAELAEAQAKHSWLEARRTALRGALSNSLASVEAAATPAGLAEAEAEVSRLEATRTALEARVDERREWSFPEEKTSSSWWNHQLTKLIGELESLVAERTGLLTEDGVHAEYGWSVPLRLALAEQLQEGFASGGEFAERWEEARPAIHATYPGLDLTVQVGLVPIGQDPDSKLWEFWHVQSGTEPLRGDDGKLAMEESSGLVFVLLPGGRFWMGAQKKDPGGHNYDLDALNHEGPVHEVELSAFFLSKYEMTQGQWKHFTGVNPSRDGPDGKYSRQWNRAGKEATLLEPVERVSWCECVALLSKLDLRLPSEAEWEYAARGGKETPWWSGEKEESLQGAANLADKYANEHGFSELQVFQKILDDGYTSHAPVDALRANPFGLHHVLGNVSELCADTFEESFYSHCPVRDPMNRALDSTNRVFRGGSFIRFTADARSARRFSITMTNASDVMGARPARAITN